MLLLITRAEEQNYYFILKMPNPFQKGVEELQLALFKMTFLSAIYKMLLHNSADPLNTIKKQWEHDIGYEINYPMD